MNHSSAVDIFWHLAETPLWQMADDGNEGLVYGLLTTIGNLGSPVAQAISNQVSALPCAPAYIDSRSTAPVFVPDLSPPTIQVFAQFTPSLDDSANYVAVCSVV